ncbi:MAG: RNHCP domain-containing protein [Candidatus Marsarchaeota archaeon]|nr:RNHCP domain-containing protein [Candidatus Marsarchaeota archaeon]MCL5106384.1 RNHCP domain-containing protein [Candidatus Marsarchaeota archaeon]
MARKFQRRIENFKCNNCGAFVKGNGYTDHCPKCLEGMHVDNNPGDRSSECRGAMKAVYAEYKSGNFIIHYKCKKCGIEKRFTAAQNDSNGALMAFFAQGNIKSNV